MLFLLNEVNSFINYLKLKINPTKCHSASYIIQEGHRVSNTGLFTFNGINIPSHNLSEWVEYLRTSAATTISLKRKGKDKTITKASKLID